uniref:Nonstructural protein n=1 Tax=Lophura nycthemera aveparvovirus TaxID=2794554 RepID=A0A8A4XDT8_9VIRU|nr:MAG: nonstructural protein [Lophura nycthemera aveparvovirus]
MEDPKGMCPIKGGYACVFMLPERITVKINPDKNDTTEISLKEITETGWQDPRTGESGAEYKDDFACYEDGFKYFHHPSGHPWQHSKWARLHWCSLLSALLEELGLHPNVHLFAQMELTEGGRVHVHVLLIKGYSSRGASWCAKRIRAKLVKDLSALFSSMAPGIPSGQIWSSLNNSSQGWFSLKRAYNPSFGKTVPQQINPHTFLKNYFYTKKAPELLFRWASPKLEEMGLKVKSADDNYTLEGVDDNPEAPVAEFQPGDLLPITYVSTNSNLTSRAISSIRPSTMDLLTMEALRLCKDKFIFTLQDFMTHYPDKYLLFASRTGGLQKLQNTIDLYTHNIVTEHNAWELCKAMYGEVDTENMEQNLAVKLCLHQGYDPGFVSHTICCWLSGALGKKNTLYFYGPANTGKTMMAEAICKMVRIYGNVNHNNGNFPFNDCHGKAVIWWEECVMVDTYVEPAKCMLGGSAVRVDKKGEDSILIRKTPVVITSNNDITQCQSRNINMTVHAAPIRSRTLKFSFNQWLTSNWGLVTPTIMYQFLYWGEQRGELSLDGWFRLNSQFDGTIPYNQPRATPCETCSCQVTAETTVELCDTCGSWKPKPDSESTYTGESEKQIYEAVGSGKGARGVHPPVCLIRQLGQFLTGVLLHLP